MQYKGYTAIVRFDEEAEIFFGEVINTKDIITFEAENVKDLKQSFYDSVDDYLNFCAERNEKPEKSFSGKFMIRTSPELHKKIYEKAFSHNMSVNNFVTQKLELA